MRKRFSYQAIDYQIGSILESEIFRRYYWRDNYFLAFCGEKVSLSIGIYIQKLELKFLRVNILQLEFVSS